MKLVVVGGSGYIGRALVKRAAAEGHAVSVLVRRRDDALAKYAAQFSFDEAPVTVDRGADAMINLAGLAHVRGRGGADFDAANRLLPLAMAQRVLEGGIGRLVHVSSLGVYGNWQPAPVTEASLPAPDTRYARSKLDGDRALEACFDGRGDALILVRPPMVYGPGCPGNFTRLRRLVECGLPLPFGAARAVRSLIFVENLADFLLKCAIPRSPAGLYVIGDGSDYSVAELVSEIALGRGRHSPNVSIPPQVLRALARIAGMRREMDSLTRPLIVDWARARELMQWHPPVGCAEALQCSLIADKP